MARTAKRHDTFDPISGVATDGNGAGIDLTQFDSVTLFADDGQGNEFSGPLTTREEDGSWTYQQSDADMSVAGVYDIELECIDGSEKVHIPNDAAANPKLTITADIDDN
jgi:hypothetical protein